MRSLLAVFVLFISACGAEPIPAAPETSAPFQIFLQGNTVECSGPPTYFSTLTEVAVSVAVDENGPHPSVMFRNDDFDGLFLGVVGYRVDRMPPDDEHIAFASSAASSGEFIGIYVDIAPTDAGPYEGVLNVALLNEAEVIFNQCRLSLSKPPALYVEDAGPTE